VSTRVDVTEVLVRKAPGFVRPFVVDGLVPGVNVVYGPNASGKSTTSRAMEAALWSASARGLSVGLRFKLGGDSCTGEYENGKTTFFLNGDRRPGLKFTSPELRKRYHLVLPDLLVADDEDFAGVIAREAAGGVDIVLAADHLGYKTPSVTGRVAKEVSEAKNRHAKTEREQQALDRRLASREALAKRVENANAAAARRDALVLAVDRSKIAERHAAEATALRSWPAAMAFVQPDDSERLDTLSTGIHEAAAEVERSSAEAAACRAEASALFEQAPNPLLLQTLRAACEALAESARARDEAGRGVAMAQASLDAAANVLGDSTRLEGGGGEGAALAHLSQVASEHDSLRTRLDTAEARLRAVTDPDGSGGDSDTLAKGITSLANWLDSTSAGVPRGRIAVVAAAGVLAMIAAAIVEPGFAMLVTLGVGSASVVAAAAWAARHGRGGDRDAHRRSFEKLGLPAPAAWSVPMVAARLRQLQEEQARAARAAEAAKERAGLDAEVVRARELLSACDGRLAAAASACGFRRPPTMLARQAFSEELRAWYAAQRDLATAKAAHEHASAAMVERLRAVHAVVEGLGYPEPCTVADAHALRDGCENRIQRYRAALAAAESLEAEVVRREKLIDKWRADIDALLTRHDLPAGPDAAKEVRHRCSKLPAYQEAVHTGQVVRASLAAADSALRRHAGFHETMLAASSQELTSELGRAAEDAETAEALRNELARLEAEVAQARSGGTLEDATAALAEARRDLEDRRAEMVLAAVGAAVADFVGRATRDADLPPVLKRAREIFGRITGDQYRLEIDPETGWIAYDCWADARRTLAELSSGTRVQLLLAVRVAFVEAHEQETRLPLLLDEVLATSDDERTAAITDAVITLAAEGRQVFYFTAQLDEVAKWERAMDGRGVPYAVIDLGSKVARRDWPGMPPLPVIVNSLVPPPEPGSDTHSEYATRLGLRSDWHVADPPGALHLWHLLDDLPALHALLAQGISTLGQLRNCAERGGSVVPAAAHVAARVMALGECIDAAHACTRDAAGKRPDRYDLSRGGVSDALMPEVCQVAQEVAWDAGRLLWRLGDRAVNGFGEGKLKKLAEYFANNGYLDAPVVSMPDVRAAFVSAAAPYLTTGTLAMADVEAAWERLFAGTGGEVAPA
jgi:DNA repair protein SbcC/Rad50